ncbi:molybdenum cofactor sulfurase [Megalops cyprinoides]|uniref:molybdenum cofactor sulfurase n=1 Tax=Megalops cyprinoides TaxID=118141 RepID=UPI001865427C|nr:molybdenum cofactor sulfurase [Megalops cyprinoides]
MGDHALDFNHLCSFESFRSAWNFYGYDGNIEDVIKGDFARIKGITYLDHAGTTLYPESLIKGFLQDMCSNIYGNPHSNNPSSRLTHDTVERARYRVLQHFNTSPEEYTVIFTSGSTAALKLVAESFPWKAPAAKELGSQFCYLTDNHTSVVGIRAVASASGAVVLPVVPEEVEARAKKSSQTVDEGCEVPHLFSYPAQSNFSGRKYPLHYIKGIQSRQLYPSCKREGSWFVLLDAASFVSCSHLDLQEHPADFVPISFYKMFGFPTGLGALLVRNSAAEILRKAYFGGGTAAAYLAGDDYYVPRPAASGRFEDGTISFLDIIALHHCFETLQKLTGGMDRIQLHTFGLARYTYMLLSSLRHSNGRPVAQIYASTEYDDPDTQGAILNFNLLDSQGSFVGYSQVDKLASLFNIQVRTGCFCNTGACQLYLGISNQEVKSNLEAGHVCGDNVDLIEGRPTGSVRVSFGYMSTFSDCQNFLKFVVDCFVQGPVKVGKENIERLRSTIPFNTQQPLPHLPNGQPNCERREEEGDLSPATKVTSHGVPAVTPGKRIVGRPGTLANIFLYPIKSCAALEVSSWPLGPLGLLYDRLWMVVNMNGVCLSQKQEPRLCLIRPQIHLATKELSLQAPGMDPVFVPLEGSSEKDLTVQVCQSKVCGDRVQTLDCGERVATWLSEFLGKPCRLIRQSPNFTRDMKKSRGKVPGESSVSLSLVNEAQYLMINKASIKLLLEHINQRQGSDSHQHSDEQQLIDRFRANLVIWGKEPFEEDDWTNIIIGDTPFKVAGPCGRCQMIGVDQSTGARSQQPLQSLSACRNGKVTFGLYLIHQLPENEADAPTLSVGSPVVPQVSNCSSKAN